MDYKKKYYIACGCIILLFLYMAFSGIRSWKLTNTKIECMNKGQCIKKSGFWGGYECIDCNSPEIQQMTKE